MDTNLQARFSITWVKCINTILITSFSTVCMRWGHNFCPQLCGHTTSLLIHLHFHSSHWPLEHAALANLNPCCCSCLPSLSLSAMVSLNQCTSNRGREHITNGQTEMIAGYWWRKAKGDYANHPQADRRSAQMYDLQMLYGLWTWTTLWHTYTQAVCLLSPVSSALSYQVR